MLELEWIRCKGGTWCPFFDVDLSGVDTLGVYVIWHTVGHLPELLDVGKGDIAERIQEHRRNEALRALENSDSVWVTWASVPESSLDGVERFLADDLSPLLGEHFPDASPIPVNLPW